MNKEHKLVSILESIEVMLKDMKRTEDRSYFDECYQEATSNLEEAFKLLGWEG